MFNICIVGGVGYHVVQSFNSVLCRLCFYFIMYVYIFFTRPDRGVEMGVGGTNIKETDTTEKWLHLQDGRVGGWGVTRGNNRENTPIAKSTDTCWRGGIATLPYGRVPHGSVAMLLTDEGWIDWNIEMIVINCNINPAVIYVGDFTQSGVPLFFFNLHTSILTFTARGVFWFLIFLFMGRSWSVWLSVAVTLAKQQSDNARLQLYEIEKKQLITRKKTGWWFC